MVVIFYDNEFISNIKSPNNNKSIEQAIAKIPACEAYDRSRQRKNLYTLKAWSELTRKYNIRYWLAYGSLAGYVQRGGLLPHDPDIDILIMGADTAQLFEISKLNLSSTYKLDIHPQWYIVDESKRSRFITEETSFQAPNGRFTRSNPYAHVDIWAAYDYNPNQNSLEKNSTAMLTIYDNNYAWLSTPKEWTFPLRECIFSGIKVWCPAQPEKLVASIYGEASVKSPYYKCFNGSWVDSEDYIQAKKMLQMKKNEQ